MTRLRDILNNLDELLEARQFQDYCPNGLQVEGKQNVSHVVTGVSASLELFQRAHEINGDLILVHHGLLWNSGPTVISGSFKRRLEYLLTRQISLVAYHLPLDAHITLGNNARVADHLGLVDRRPFAEYKGKCIGVIGQLKSEMAFQDFLSLVQQVFNRKVLCYTYGRSTIKSVAIVTGGAPEKLIDAVEAVCDCYITGEVSESTLHLAKDEMTNFIAAGHYNTEMFGVQALGDTIAKEFKIQHTFIDIPNPV